MRHSKKYPPPNYDQWLLRGSGLNDEEPEEDIRDLDNGFTAIEREGKAMIDLRDCDLENGKLYLTKADLNEMIDLLNQ